MSRVTVLIRAHPSQNILRFDTGTDAFPGVINNLSHADDQPLIPLCPIPLPKEKEWLHQSISTFPLVFWLCECCGETLSTLTFIRPY